ncbi:hypothetical protein DKG77_09830 [Flagellimonas aquimarina]|uniref:Uncharacterized protein n=1 Tax=Flagellimonas aquimarina TaxID=2201895 RepID=A0A316KWD0_9FLAO|nr:hypothetical protein [Allomuricauda koreensis]PWL38552.1 hypothetical protein DKG77_09830 [Allomuricauda koreensis]
MENNLCPECKNDNNEPRDVCMYCQFPFKGSEKEKAVHIGAFISKQGIITDSSDSIIKSKKILFAVSAVNIVFLIVSFFLGNKLNLDLALTFLITLIIFLCGLFIEKNPLLLTIVPLFLIVGIMILNTMLDPSSFFNGLVINLIIIGSLVYSVILIQSAKAFKKKYRTG